MGFTFMHLSDLHRSESDPISNTELVSALRSDRARQGSGDHPIDAPDALVVSGDLVQGLGVGAIGYPEALRGQYVEAEDLLRRLADEFLGGDRSRLVIVPGNHDVDWNAARKAMAEASKEEHAMLPRLLQLPHSPFRWSWNDLRLYKVLPEPYAARLAEYRAMHSRFYDSLANVDVKGGRDWNLFPMDGGRVVVAAFESVHGNDCFRACGAIRSEAIADAHLAIGQLPVEPELAVAVWHHGLLGDPLHDDYMDPATVMRIAGSGFRLGLHGHHHKSVVSPVNALGFEETIMLVGAGSLCAGGGDLPTGAFRQYNMVEVLDGYSQARVHVRQMAVAGVFTAATMGGGIQPWVDVFWKKPSRTVSSGRSGGKHVQAADRAEALLRAGKGKEALAALDGLDARVPYVRLLRLRALEHESDWAGVLRETGRPGTGEELGRSIKAALALTQWDAAQALVNLARADGILDAGNAREFAQRIETSRRMKA